MPADGMAPAGGGAGDHGDGAHRCRLHRRDDRSFRARRTRPTLRCRRDHIMNLFKYFKDEIEVEIERLAGAGKLPSGLELSRIAVEPPRDPAHGDISTNAAMVLAKPAGRPPREIAELVAGALRSHAEVTEASVAGPGFINLRLADRFWHARLTDVLRAGPSYGDSAVGAGRPVNVEYVSANPTGPMHVG